MRPSFYTAGAGVSAMQSKFDIISNNLANQSTTGYKSKSPVFSELMYSNYQNGGTGHLQYGKGAKIARGNATLQEDGGYQQTDGNLDFSIAGRGFFAVSDIDGEDILYTRDGRFMISKIEDVMYLTNASGQLVLNEEGDPIEMDGLSTDVSLDKLNIGVFNIPFLDGMEEDGFNNFKLTDKNGEPEAIESPDIQRGSLEASNVDMAKEFSQIIESQKAYSLTLKMLQTADEIEQDINTLRR